MLSPSEKDYKILDRFRDSWRQAGWEVIAEPCSEGLKADDPEFMAALFSPVHIASILAEEHKERLG